MNLFINGLNSQDVLTSYNFARNSDVVFSETVTHQQFSELNKDNDLEIIFKNSYLVFYVQKKFELSENNIIFTNTYFIDNLFEILREVKHLKNIKLITHQTDIPITEKIYKNKPDCISEWYSINVDFEHKDLISLPLGLANYYSPKNVFKESFQKLTFNKNPKLSLYINYKINTNSQERKKLRSIFINKDWVVFKEPSDDLEAYIKDLNKYKFILSPWGNGYDTHRFWETLYSGSIPVTKQHITYNSASGLPILFVNDYKNLTKSDLFNFLENTNFEKIDYKKLKIGYWLDLINENINEDTLEESQIIENLVYKKFIQKYNQRASKENKIKRILFRVNQIKKIPFKLIEIFRK